MGIEPKAVKALHAEKTAALIAFAQREQELTEGLVALVPSNLAKWSRESTVVTDIVAFGFASRKYRMEHGGVYGYTDLVEFARRFDALRAAWSGVVDVNASWDGTERFELTCTAA